MPSDKTKESQQEEWVESLKGGYQKPPKEPKPPPPPAPPAPPPSEKK
jgi:hypothetical protein